MTSFATGRDSVLSREIVFPRGFDAHVAALGLRAQGNDLAIIYSDRPAQCVAMFTKSRFAGPSVALSRARAETGRCRAVVIVAKNANVATGLEGMRNAEEVTELAATALGASPEETLICSTGVIGRQYPMQAFRQHFVGNVLEGSVGTSPMDVATAMMTTDTKAKVAERTVGNARIVGVAKGVGMVEPDMATLLAIVTTDAEIESETLAEVWRSAVDETLNCLSVDTDTSTSDTAILLASGLAGQVNVDEFATELRALLLDLTLQLARDGEGATKLLTVTVSGARDKAQARRVAKAILNSPLVKTAVHGADPNWGRVAMAVGKCQDDTDIEPDLVSIWFGDCQVYPDRSGAESDLAARLRSIMSASEVPIQVDLGLSDHEGSDRATVYGCDLSAEYVRINADYTT